MIQGDLFSAFAHRQFHTLPGLLSPYLTGMETSWRLESPWVAETSPGDLAGREKVAVKSNMFDFFCDTLETCSSLQLVSAIKYVFEEEDVSATCSRPND